MRSSTIPISQKIDILNHLLNALHGYYSMFFQAYTENKNDKEIYETNYKDAEKYLNFIEEHCIAWLHEDNSPETIKIKKTYNNYSQFAKLYLFDQCKPPHPSETIDAESIDYLATQDEPPLLAKK